MIIPGIDFSFLAYQGGEYGDHVIVHGDCLEVMAKMPDKCVGLVLTDPPYEKEAHASMKRTRAAIEGRKKEDNVPFDNISEDTRYKFVKTSCRLGRGWIVNFCQAEAVGLFQSLYGASWRRAMVWIKPDSAPQYIGDRPAMGYESLCAAWSGNGKSHWNGGGKRGVFQYNTTDFKHYHPTQKPIKLLMELVSLFSGLKDIVFDPFLGSGSTLVAAKQLGRRGIGIEIERNYCEIADERLRQEELSLTYEDVR